MAPVHHHALEVWRQAQAQAQRFQVRERLVALAPHGQLRVARFDFYLASQINMSQFDPELHVLSQRLSYLLSMCSDLSDRYRVRTKDKSCSVSKTKKRPIFQFLQIGFILDSGPAAGSPCIFPFKWAGVTYILCSLFKWTVEHWYDKEVQTSHKWTF